jgi:BolA protein
MVDVMSSSDPAAASGDPATTPGPIAARIEALLAAAFDPVALEVINESHQHKGPPGRESHFKVVVVTEAFEGVSLVQRHRQVNAALAATFAAGVHALSIVARTPAQWAAEGHAVPASPRCRGGSSAS